MRTNLLTYLAAIALGVGALLAYGCHQRQIGERDVLIRQARVERDSAEMRYQRARTQVVHDTVIVRQAVAGWQQRSTAVRKDIDTGLPAVPAAQVRELLDAGDTLATRCAQFIDHTERLVVAADTLNLASKEVIHLQEQRNPSKLGKVVSLGIAALAGLGAGVLFF